MALTRPRLGQLDTSVIAGTDPIAVLHAGSTTANVDIGLLMNRANGLVSNVAIYWNESGNTFVTAFTTNSGVIDSNITATSYAPIRTGAVTTTGNLTITGNIVPSANVTYDIGSPTQRFRSIYLSGNTIDLAGAVIKTDPTSGAIALVPQATTTNPNPTGIVITPAGSITTIVTVAGVVDVANIANVANISANTATTTFANVSTTGNLTVGSNLTVSGSVLGNINLSGNLTIGGNLSAINAFIDRGSDINDWNSLTTMGVYLVNRSSWSGTSNVPANSQYFTGQVEVVNTGNVSIAQFYRPYNSTSSGDIYWTRSKHGSNSWSSWVEVINGAEVMDGGSF